MTRPINPNITIPANFAENGQKSDFTAEKISNGFNYLEPDVLSGDNLNKFIDDTYKGLTYTINGVTDLYDAYDSSDFVSKSGDTMSGSLQFSKIGGGVIALNAISEGGYSDIQYTKTDGLRVGFVRANNVSATERNLQISVCNDSGTPTSHFLLKCNNNVNSCIFPNTTCVDGQWVTKTLTITTVANSTSVDTYSLLDYLPKDNYCYEVMFCFYFYDTGDKCGSCYIESDVFLPNNATNNADASQEALSNLDRPFGFTQANQNNRSISQVLAVPVGTGRYIKVKCTDANTQRRIYAAGYRRLGTNA